MAAKESGIVYLLPDQDSNYSVKSTEDGKVLTLRLAAFEYFKDKYNSGLAYKCNKQCTICSENKYNMRTDEESLSKLILEKGNSLMLTTEARNAINRDLLHDFFKRESGNVTMTTEQNMNSTKKGPNQSTGSGDKAHVVRIYLRRNKEQAERNRSGPENGHRYSVNRLKQRENNKLSQPDVIDLTNEDEEPGIVELTEYPREKTRAEAPGKFVSNSFNRKLMDDPNGRFNTNRYEPQRDMTRADRKYGSNPFNVNPMDDPNGRFNTNRYESQRYMTRAEEKYGSNALNVKPIDYPNGRFNTNRYESQRYMTRADGTYGSNPFNVKPIDDPNGRLNTNRYEPQSGMTRADRNYGSNAFNAKPMDDPNGRLNTNRYGSQRDMTRADGKYGSNTFNVKPMDDPNGRFYIDRYELDVRMYADGLKHNHWNPTQSLYEIANKCKWSRPLYKIIPVQKSQTKFKEFACEAIINGQSFWTDRSTLHRKCAQHMASAKVLNFVGFDFRYPPDFAYGSPINSDVESCGEYNCEINSSVKRSGGGTSECDHQEQENGLKRLKGLSVEMSSGSSTVDEIDECAYPLSKKSKTWNNIGGCGGKTV